MFPRRARLFPGLSVGIPKIPMAVSTRFFFDKGEVLGALDKLERHALSRSSLLVRRTAQKSIRKMGMARPKLKIQKNNPGALPSMLLRQKGLRKSTRRALEDRVLQLTQRPPSPPGSPPHTHVPHSHMLGFRRNLYNAMDPISMQSPLKKAVVGPAKRGDDWTIPHLHEFGGTKTLTEYVFTPSLAYTKSPTVILTWRATQTPWNNNWVPTGRTKDAVYPERPFLLPALRKCIPRIQQLYGGQFKGRRVSTL